MYLWCLHVIRNAQVETVYLWCLHLIHNGLVEAQRSGGNSVFMVPARDTQWSGRNSVFMVPARDTQWSGGLNGLVQTVYLWCLHLIHDVLVHLWCVYHSLVKAVYKFTKPARDTRFPCIRSFKKTRRQSQTLSLFLISVQYSYEQIFI